MKQLKYFFLASLFGAALFVACKKEPAQNPDNKPESSIVINISEGETLGSVVVDVDSKADLDIVVIKQHTKTKDNTLANIEVFPNKNKYSYSGILMFPEGEYEVTVSVMVVDVEGNIAKKSEIIRIQKIENNQKAIAVTGSVNEITFTSATIYGTLILENCSVDDVEVGMDVSTEPNFVNITQRRIKASNLNDKLQYSIFVDNLNNETKYYYRAYVIVKGKDTFYGNVAEFSTLSRNLSEKESANCFIVTSEGEYRFAANKGNTSIPIQGIKTVEVIWETFGSITTPSAGDLIKKASYKDGNIVIVVSNQKGSALIAAKDNAGTILWSWHIWMTEPPQDQTYNNDAGTMMDRNLGAISADKTDNGARFCMLYQWGRKDPFLGGYKNRAASTLSSWPIIKIEEKPEAGTIKYAIENPTSYIKGENKNTDWLASEDLTRWGDKKTEYDPCPPGYRVPSEDIWKKALGKDSSKNQSDWDSNYNGVDFAISSVKLGNYPSIWYPGSGYFNGDNEISESGIGGYYWSNGAFNMSNGMADQQGRNLYIIMYEGIISAYSIMRRDDACAVRCQKMQ